MTRSSTKELFTPFKEPKREFRSSRKLFKTLSLNESRSPEFNLFLNLEEYSKEEVAKTMAETMEYGSDHEDTNEHIEKVFEIVDLFHIPNITQDQVMIRAFPMSLTRAICVRIRSTETSDRLAAMQAQLNNLRREIKKVNEKVCAAQVRCKQCKGPNYTKYCPLKEEELRRDQVNDLMTTIEEGEVIDEPMIDIIKSKNNKKFDEYLSFCHFDWKIRIDCAYNLRFSCMIVVENMDGYRDQDMGDTILGEPFCKASCMESKRFDGLITIHNGSDNVTYQMAQSHPRFKHLSNAQCNKIKPLLKVSLHDKLNGISHPYQKLKNFYKGVLNLGPQYVRDAKMEEWLTRGHISMHETE
nr:hypothetical protein [Tanacetum cinerariifolium]